MMYKVFSFLFFGLTALTVLAFSGGISSMFEKGYIWYLLFLYFVVYVSFVLFVFLKTFFDVKKDVFVKKISKSISEKVRVLGDRANLIQAFAGLFLAVVFSSIIFLLTVRGIGLLLGKMFSDELKSFGELVGSGASAGERVMYLENRMYADRKSDFFEVNSKVYTQKDGLYTYRLGYERSRRAGMGFDSVYVYELDVCKQIEGSVDITCHKVDEDSMYGVRGNKYSGELKGVWIFQDEVVEDFDVDSIDVEGFMLPVLIATVKTDSRSLSHIYYPKYSNNPDDFLKFFDKPLFDEHVSTTYTVVDSSFTSLTLEKYRYYMPEGDPLYDAKEEISTIVISASHDGSVIAEEYDKELTYL